MSTMKKLFICCYLVRAISHYLIKHIDDSHVKNIIVQLYVGRKSKQWHIQYCQWSIKHNSGYFKIYTILLILWKFRNTLLIVNAWLSIDSVWSIKMHVYQNTSINSIQRLALHQIYNIRLLTRNDLQLNFVCCLLM